MSTAASTRGLGRNAAAGIRAPVPNSNHGSQHAFSSVPRPPVPRLRATSA